MPSRRLSLFAVLAVLLAGAPTAFAQTCTAEWASASSGNWNTASLWSTGAVPGPTDHACITRGGTYTVTLGANVTVGRLTLGGESGAQTLGVPGGRTLTLNDTSRVGARGVVALAGTLRRNGRLAIAGTFNWTDGILDGSGEMLLTGTSTFSSAASKSVVAGALVNTGTLAWTEGALYIYDGVVIDNRGTFEADAASTVYPYGGTDWRFVNAGTLRRTVAGTVAIDVTFENTGTVEARAGTIRFTRTSTHRDATVTASAGAAVRLEGGAHTVTGRLSGAPQGEVVLTSTLAAGAGGGALAFTGTGLRMDDGNVDAGPGGLVNAGLLTFSSAASKSVRTGTLVNTGTLAWTEGALYIYDGAAIDNRGLFDVRAANTLYPYGGTNWRLVNTGTLRRSGPGATVVDVTVENTGTLDVREGTLRLSRASTHLGVTPTVAAGATLDFGGGAHAFTGTSFAVPAGSTLLFSSGTHQFGGTVAFAPEGAVRFTGGSMGAAEGGGTLNIGGTGLRWEGGSVATGANVLRNAGLVHLAGTAAKTVTTGTFRNDGTVRWAEGGFSVATAGTFENAGLFEAAVPTYVSSASSPGLFANTGRVVRTAGAGLVDFLARFENRAGGVLDVVAGTLRFRGALQNLPGALLRGSGTVDVGSTAFTNAGRIAPGASPGLLRLVTTSFRPAATAALEIELAGPGAGTGYDRLAVTGAAALNGTLDVRMLGGFGPAVGDTFTVIRSTGALTGGFARRTGLVDAGRNVALYPAITAGRLTLTAATVPTLVGAISASPNEVVGNALRLVALTGTGFAPDLAVTLECAACGDGGGASVVPGIVGTISPTAVSVTFDLASGRAFGAYALVVRDPRGGEARTPFFVTEGPLVLTVVATRNRASEDGAVVGAFTIRSNRRAPQAISVPFGTSGSARPYLDYVLGVNGSTVTLAAGADSAVVPVYALGDAVADPGETVTLTVLAPRGALVGTPASATITVVDGPLTNTLAVFAVTPERGGDAGLVLARLAGRALRAGTTVRLVGGGGAITGTDVTVSEGGGEAFARFDLRGVARGAYDVVVGSGGEEATLAGAFTVEPRSAVQIQGDLVGPPERIRVGRETRYNVLLWNRSNNDVHDVIAFVRFSKSVEYRLVGPTDASGYAPPGSYDKAGGEAGVDYVVPVWFYRIPAGQSASTELYVKPSTGQAGTSLYVGMTFIAPPATEAFTWTGNFDDARDRIPYNLSGFFGGIVAAQRAAENAGASSPSASRGQAALAAEARVDACVADSQPLSDDQSLMADVNRFQNTRDTFSEVAKETIWTGLKALVVGAAKVVVSVLPTRFVPGVVRNVAIGLAADAAFGPDNLKDVAQDRIQYRACPTALGSFDPNDKTGPGGAGDGRHVQPSLPFSYTIRFENLATATAPAQEVTVVDTLDAAVFDLATFRLGSITFAGRTVTPPEGVQTFSTEVDLRPGRNLVVRVFATLERPSGRVLWTFAALDPATGTLPEDPLEGFLPPNRTSPEGEGAVSFAVRLREGLPTGRAVRNDARIVFDVNPPIDTPVWANTVDRSAPSSRVVAARREGGGSAYRIAWSGTDDGAGIDRYAVFVSEAGGAFSLWTVTADTSAVFEGEPGRTYGFYVTARDGAGNREPGKSEAEVTVETVVGVEDDAGAGLPAAFALHQNQPNPFNPRSVIRYDVREHAHVTLTVFDATGRAVTKLVDVRQTPGRYTAAFDAGALASGVYFYRIEMGGFSAVKRMVLVR